MSLFDLWLLSLFRALLFGLLILAFCLNKLTVLKRVKQLAPLYTVLLILIFCFSVVKVLTSFEFYEDGSPVHGSNSTTAYPTSNPCDIPCPDPIGPSEKRRPSHPWLWATAGWSATITVLYGVIYKLITKIKPHVSLQRNRHLFVDVKSGEEAPLMGEEVFGEGEEGEAGKKTSTMRVMWTILTYTRTDVHLYISGFTFLVISSAAMSFIPYYTGQIINHIAISPSEASFQRSILIMVGISIISAVTAGLRGSILIVANGRLNVRVRRTLFKSLMRQEIGFFDQTETGDLTSRLTSDTTKLADQIGLNLNIFLRYDSTLL